MNVAVQSASPAKPFDERIRVMIVDDAVLVRGLFTRWIEAERDLQVVASLRTGREAVDQLERANPDVVLLDIEMPELDGMSALPLLLEKRRDLVVIMASTLTRRNAEISLKALSIGAADYIPKPASNKEVGAASGFRRELIEKVRGLGVRSKRQRGFSTPAARIDSPPTVPSATPPKSIARAMPAFVAAGQQLPGAPVVLRPFPFPVPRVLVIGSSTGGPPALNKILKGMGEVLDRAPVLITQHMPPTFTAILAEHLARIAGRPAREAQDGEEINAGTIYIAPGGKHMKVARRDGIAVIAIDDGPMVNFCKPAVDPLFASAATVWGQWVLGLVLTGMGSDGLRGAQQIVAAGGGVMAQDEPTSVVWGMPGQVAHAGLCSAVLPLDEIASRVTRLFAGVRA